MNKEKLKKVIPFILFIVGILFLIFSCRLGYFSSMYETYQKGIVLTENLSNIYTALSIFKYICLGFLVSLLGGLGIINFYYKNNS